MLISLKDVSFTYSAGTPFENRALNGINLEIDKGEFVGIIGHTGCGKSTLIQVIAGLLTPESGQVLIDGKDIFEKGYDRKQLRRTLGVVFQYPEYQLFEETVDLDISYGPRKAGYSEEETEEHVAWAYEQLGLNREALKEMSPFELSGGQKRKVAIAGVLALRPDILVLDEPIAGLDPKGRNEFMAFVRSLREQGMTIIMISHNMDGLAEEATRILVMKDDTPKSVFTDTEMLESLSLGTSEAHEIAEMLKEKGIDQSVITYSELLEELLRRYSS